MIVVLQIDLTLDKFKPFSENLKRKNWKLKAIGCKEDGTEMHSIIEKNKLDKR
jgi:hypothetical protein